MDEDVNQWLYKEEDDINLIKLPLDQYGNGFRMLQKHGYDGTTGLGPHKQGRIEPILPQENLKNQGLGYKATKKITKAR